MHFFQIKYTEAILSSSTGKLRLFEITKMLVAVLKSRFIVLFIIFGTLSFPISEFTDWETSISHEISRYLKV